MKKTAIILSVLALAGLATSCKNQAAPKAEAENTEKAELAGSIVFFDLDRVLEEYDMANELRTTVETKVQSISEEVNRRQTNIEKDIQKFQNDVQKGLLVSSVAQQRQEKLQKAQADFQNYAAQKQQEIAEEQQTMMNRIADAIKTYVDNYNAEKGYAMILTTQGDLLPAPVVTASPSLDITDDILAGLNAEYVKTKKENK